MKRNLMTFSVLSIIMAMAGEALGAASTTRAAQSPTPTRHYVGAFEIIRQQANVSPKRAFSSNRNLFLSPKPNSTIVKEFTQFFKVEDLPTEIEEPSANSASPITASPSSSSQSAGGQQTSTSSVSLSVQPVEVQKPSAQPEASPITASSSSQSAGGQQTSTSSVSLSVQPVEVQKPSAQPEVSPITASSSSSSQSAGEQQTSTLSVSVQPVGEQRSAAQPASPITASSSSSSQSAGEQQTSTSSVSVQPVGEQRSAARVKAAQGLVQKFFTSKRLVLGSLTALSLIGVLFGQTQYKMVSRMFKTEPRTRFSFLTWFTGIWSR